MLKLLLTLMAHVLLREKDLAKLRHIQGIKIRLSVDGWGPAEEYTRQDTVWEENLMLWTQILQRIWCTGF